MKPKLQSDSALAAPCLAPAGGVLVSTFSIVAADLEAGDVGVAVQSKFPNVRPVVPWAEAGVGAVATQANMNVSFGPKGLALLRNGATAVDALRILLANDTDPGVRQVGIVDCLGNAACWTGGQCWEWAGGCVGGVAEPGGRGELVSGAGYAAMGNILVGRETVQAMAETFESTPGHLAERLLAALVAGGQAGGDRRGEQSAALLVRHMGAGYDGTTDDLVDIGIYDHPRPLQELERLFQLHKLYFYPADEAGLVAIDAAICAELQAILGDPAYKGIQFYDGPVDGRFGPRTQAALQQFMGWENYDVRIRDDDRIDREVLADIRRNYAAWKAQAAQA
jgi:uncharacterized Ntn-hydrolase superfamily protein